MASGPASVWYHATPRFLPADTVRALFLALLLANLLFLAWSRWIEPPAPPAQAMSQGAAPALRPIRLQQEAQAGTTADGGRGEVAPGMADVTAASCVSVGPFAAEAQAHAAAASLRRLGFESRLRAAQDEVRVGYWVRVADFATAADARNALGALQAVGLADAYVVANAPGSGTSISIGVYTDPQRAAAAAGRVARAGFTPQTSDRLRTLDVFWLDVDRQANGGIPVLEDVAVPAGDLPIELRACPSAPVDSAGPAAPDGRAGGVG